VLELVELVLELLPEPVLEELVHGPKPLGFYQRPERQELAPYLLQQCACLARKGRVEIYQVTP
jgi:hypothetical protein